MKFRCERDILVDALGAVARAVGTRGGALPVLAGTRLELSGDELQLTATDLDLTVEARVTVAGERDGVSVVPARLLADITRALEPGAVEIEVDEEQAHISLGRSQFSVRVYPASDYPQLPQVDGPVVSLPATGFAEGLRQVVRAASTDDNRPVLTGVLISAEEGGLRLVATDSYRLAVRDLPSDLELGQSILVPSRALQELGRHLGSAEELELCLGTSQVTFSVEGLRITTNRIEGDYPNYRGLIPQDYPNRLRVGREPMIEALRRVRLMAQENAPVRLVQQDGSVELIALTTDIGQANEAVDGAYEGSEITIAFNPEYLLDALEAATGDEVVLSSLDALKPAVLRSADDDDYLYLLMPVRVS